MAAKGFGSAEELEAALREYVAALPEGQVEDDTLTLVLALALALTPTLTPSLSRSARRRSRGCRSGHGVSTSAGKTR